MEISNSNLTALIGDILLYELQKIDFLFLMIFDSIYI